MPSPRRVYVCGGPVLGIGVSVCVRLASYSRLLDGNDRIFNAYTAKRAKRRECEAPEIQIWAVVFGVCCSAVAVVRPPHTHHTNDRGFRTRIKNGIAIRMVHTTAVAQTATNSSTYQQTCGTNDDYRHFLFGCLPHCSRIQIVFEWCACVRMCSTGNQGATKPNHSIAIMLFFAV